MEKPKPASAISGNASDLAAAAPPFPWFWVLDDPIAKWVSRNPVLSATAAAFFLIVLDVLTIARYRVDTALAIISTADTAKVVVGVAAAVGPLVLPAMALLCWAWRQQLVTTGREPTIVTLAFFGFALLAFLSSSVLLVVGYFAFYAVADWLPRFLTRRRGMPARGYLPVGQHRTSFFLFLVVLAFLPIAENPSPWLPEEIVSSQGGQQLVGYVVGESGTFTMVLTASDRMVVFTKTEEILSRTICHADSGWILRRAPSIASPPIGPICP